MLSSGWVTAIYSAIAATWILLSDAALAQLQVPSVFIASVAKGLSFVAVTGAALYALLQRRERELERHWNARVRASDRVHAVHERFKQLFARSPVPMFRMSADGQLLDANAAFLDLLRSTEGGADIPGSLLDLVVDPEERTQLGDLLTNAGQVRAAEVRFVKLDDAVFWGRLTAVRVAGSERDVIEGTLEDITLERQARDAAQMQSVLFEQLPSAVVIADVDRKITSWNARAEEFLGLDSTARGRLSSDVLIGAKPGMAERVREEQARTGRWEGEADIVRHDGKLITVAVSTALVRDSENRPIGFSMVFTDLSKEKRARQQLRFQANLLDQVENAVIATDLEGDVVYWNSAAEDMYGMTASEALGRRFDEVVVPDASRLDTGAILDEIGRSGVWQGEFEIARKEGTAVPVLASYILYRDADGEPAGLVGVSTDLTDLRSAEHQADRSSRLAQAVLDSILSPVAVISAAGQIIDVNEAWNSFSQESGADVSTNEMQMDYLAPVRAAMESDLTLTEVADGVQSVLEGRSPLFTYRYSVQAPDHVRWFEMQVTSVSGVGAVIAHIDLTAEVMAQQVLEKTVQDKDQFLATVSHELRTPLTAVLGFAEHLRSGVTDPGEVHVYYETIADQAREVADLVEDLLLAGRLDTDTIAIRPETVKPSHMIESVVRPWSGTVDFEIPDPPDDVLLSADPLRARQVLRNLVTNAIRHGVPPFQIRVGHAGDAVNIDVIDHGQGIPANALEEIYEPYTEASTRHGQPGSVGLGLYVSRRLATLMDGDLSYRRDGETTVFTLTLPRAST